MTLRAYHFGRGRRLFAKALMGMMVAAVCVTTLIPATAAENNDTIADADNGLAEIIVSARRAEENIQRVPVALNVFTEERLQEFDIKDMTRLQVVTPGINLCCTVWNNATLTVVRGIQRGAPNYFADAPVSPQGYSNFFDISSMEVLKGPQGTLFGQAAIAGAFVYEPRKPGNELGGYVSLTAGDFSKRAIEGALNLPLFQDRLLVRLAAVTDSRDGYVHDLSTNVNYGNEDYYIVRPSVVWKITDNLENYTLFQYSSAKTNGNSSGLWVLEDFNFIPSQFTLASTLAKINGGSLAAFNALKDQELAWQLSHGPYTVLGGSLGCANTQTQGATHVTSIAAPIGACPGDWHIDKMLVNTTTYRFNDNWSIKDIYSFDRKDDFNGPQDLTNDPLILQHFNSPLSVPSLYRDWANEFQVHGRASVFDFVLGTFHFHETPNNQDVFTTALVTTTASRTDQTNTSQAYYANSNVHISDRWSASIGARYTKDNILQTSYNLNPNTLAVTAVTGGPNSPFGHADFSNVSYTAGLQFQVTPDTMVFLTNSRGYNTGGLQPVVGFESYKPATLNNIELGVKSTFDIGPVKTRVNASTFYGWFNDVQVNVVTLSTNSITDQTTFQNVTRNAAKALLRGAEGDITFVPTDLFEVNVLTGYLDNKYTSFPALDPLTLQPIDISDTLFTRAPQWKVDVRPTVHLPVPPNIGKISISADWAYQSQITHQLSPLIPTDPNNPQSGLRCSRQRTAANGYGPLTADGGTAWLDCKPGHSTVDLNAMWRDVMGQEHVTLSFSLTNLTNNVWTGSQANLDRSTGSTAFEPAPPRMYALSVRYDF